MSRSSTFGNACNLRALLVTGLQFSIVCGVFAVGLRADETKKSQKERIAQLIRDLHDDNFKARDKAVRDLIKIGKPAYEAVLKLSKNSNDAEIKFRTARILKQLRILFRNFTTIDLQKKANLELDSSFHGYEGNHLQKLPKGDQGLGGVRFHIGKKMIQLASKRAEEFPEKVEGISVAGRFTHLHFLHATGWGSPGTVKDETQIGHYLVRFEDKSTDEIPIEYGTHVRDWWNWDDSTPTEAGEVAWEGDNPAATGFSVRIRLYRTSWKNPKPDKTISSIDYVSVNETVCAPFCVAITGEKAADGKDKEKPKKQQK